MSCIRKAVPRLIQDSGNFFYLSKRDSLKYEEIKRSPRPLVREHRLGYAFPPLGEGDLRTEVILNIE